MLIPPRSQVCLECSHRACSDFRTLSQQRCSSCHQRIGFDTAIERDPQQELFTQSLFAHAQCPQAPAGAQTLVVVRRDTDQGPRFRRVVVGRRPRSRLSRHPLGGGF